MDKGCLLVSETEVIYSGMGGAERTAMDGEPQGPATREAMLSLFMSPVVSTGTPHMARGGDRVLGRGVL